MPPRESRIVVFIDRWSYIQVVAREGLTVLAYWHNNFFVTTHASPMALGILSVIFISLLDAEGSDFMRLKKKN